MAQWYRQNRPGGNNLWLYSERGLMSHLVSHLLAEHLNLVLRQARNQNGVTLGDVIPRVRSHLTLAEFELGPQGFGTPDGAVFIDSGDKKSFIFVEAKQGIYVRSWLAPRIMTQHDLAQPNVNIDRECRENKFNSSINGQLELRWRFVNAFLASVAANVRLVAEQRANLQSDLMSSDRFYWRLSLIPNPSVPEHWRRVGMADAHECLYELLSEVDNEHFFLLAITNDAEVPDFAQTLRMYDVQGNRANVAGRVFWLSRTAIEQELYLL